MKSLQLLRSPKERHLLNLSQTRPTMSPLPRHSLRKKVPSRRRFPTKPRTSQNQRVLGLRNPTRTRPGGHPRARRITTPLRDIGTPILLSCGFPLNTGTLIRCIPALALSTTPSLITHPERTLPQPRVTGHQCTGIISLRTLSKRPERTTRQCTILLRRRQLWFRRYHYPPVDRIPHLDDVSGCIILLYP